MRVRVLVLALVVAVVVACGGPPSVIRDEMATTAEVKAGAATIVVFTDFQCPFCRKAHAALAPIVEARRDRVRVVLRHVPLPRHPDARTAARAAVCVETLTRPLLDDYVHALFEAQDLSEAACEELAVERGVDRDRFQRCLADAATDARVERDLAAFDAVGGDGVPLLYVGRTRLEGAPSRSRLEAAVDDAIAGK
ncbi:MAG: thioredoxin domain-containing protein [Labilithrix sp.]|nr:thioredoxin domain-containing protein [Labilithrix sp.]MBX3224262.1 thioredoxin domain-containing protein [Labilithrix sp.]